MDKIYTRKRIRLPYIRYMGFRKRKNALKQKLMFQGLIILIIAFTTLNAIVSSFEPILDKVCKDVAIGKATIISNNVATEVMKKYSYDDFVKISKDTNGNISMLQSNIITINEVTSDVAVKIQEELINSEESTAKIKFRKFFWNKAFFWNWSRYKNKTS